MKKVFSKFKSFFTSQNVSLIFSLVVTIATVFNIFIWQTSKQQIEQSKSISQAEFLMNLNRDFYFNDRLLGIRKAIYDDKPILKINKGTFDEADLEDYLGMFEMIYMMVERNEIDYKLVDDFFGGDVMWAYENKEIMNYILKQRKEYNEQYFYSGFEDWGRKSEGKDLWKEIENNLVK